MKVSVAAEAERELVEGARYYAAQANAELGLAFISEFERSVEVLRSHPELGARWRFETRRMPLRRFPYSVIYLLYPNDRRPSAAKARLLERQAVGAGVSAETPNPSIERTCPGKPGHACHVELQGLPHEFKR